LGWLGKWWPWWLWAVALFVIFRRHPVIVDSSSLESGRKWLALVALIVFVLCFTVAPVIESGP